MLVCVLLLLTGSEQTWERAQRADLERRRAFWTVAAEVPL